MKRKQKALPVAESGEDLAVVIEDRKPLAWETVFSCQRHPIHRSELVTAFISGTPLAVERVPVVMLADTLLMATAAREHCEAEVVDDYTALVARMDDTFKRDDFTRKICDSAFLTKVSFITWGSFPFVCENEQCVPALAAWYLNQNAVPSYFSGGEL